MGSAVEESPLPLSDVQYLVTQRYLRDLGRRAADHRQRGAAQLRFPPARHHGVSGERMMQVFTWFHSGVAVLTFLVQITLTRLTETACGWMGRWHA